MTHMLEVGLKISVAEDDFELLNIWSRLHLQSTRITGMFHHSWCKSVDTNVINQTNMQVEAGGERGYH